MTKIGLGNWIGIVTAFFTAAALLLAGLAYFGSESTEQQTQIFFRELKKSGVIIGTLEGFKVEEVNGILILTKNPTKKSNDTPAASKEIVTKGDSVRQLPTYDSSYAVQIASRRSAEAAREAWKRASLWYPSVLGGRRVDIRRAPIMGKGVYFRVRVPVSSKNEGQKLCVELKQAGGDCLVTR